MNQRSAFDINKLSRAGTYNSAAKKIRKAMDKMHATLKLEKHQEELLDQAHKKVAQLEKSEKVTRNELTKHEKRITKLETEIVKLKAGILSSERFDWKKEAVKLKGDGEKINAIAKTVGKDRSTVSRFLNSDEAKQY
jgi:ParB-like chromosome segregation protein Spo0J